MKWDVVFGTLLLLTLFTACVRGGRKVGPAKEGRGGGGKGAKAIKDLIQEATSWFPKAELRSKAYPLFRQRVRKGGTTYWREGSGGGGQEKATQRNWTIKTRSRDAHAPLILIDKGEEETTGGKTPLFIVLIEAGEGNYTAHKAYLTSWGEEKSVEWDTYDKGPPMKPYQNILTAFTPSAFIAWQTEEKGRMDSSSEALNRQSPIRPPQTSTTRTTTTSTLPPSQERGGEEGSSVEGTSFGAKVAVRVSSSEEEPEGQVLLHLSCPKGSGAVVVGSACKCPPGTVLRHQKCVDKKKCKRGRKDKDGKCGKAVISSYIVPVSDEVVDEGPAFEDEPTGQLTHRCPKESGATLEATHCVCPAGSLYKTDEKKCRYPSNPSGSTEDEEGTSPADEPISTTTAPPTTELTTTKGTTEKTTESPIPYLSADLPETTTKPPLSTSSSSEDTEEVEELSKNPSQLSGRAMGRAFMKKPDEEDEGTTTSSPPHQTTLPIEPEEGTSSTRTPPVLTNLLKFSCPEDSAAILKGDRCFCPKGMLLKGRKCIAKVLEADGEVKKGRQRDAPSSPFEAEASDWIDILLVNNLKKRRADYYNPYVKGRSHSQPWMEEDRGQRKGGEDLRVALRTYSIGNDKDTGHPLFQSPTLPYTGLMPCPFLQKKVQDFKGPLHTALLDFYLHTLRAQCYPGIRNATLHLFQRKIIGVERGRGGGTEIKLNLKSPLMKQKVVNEKDWQDLISALFLSKYSEAFEEGRRGNDEEESGHRDPHRPSPSIRTLTRFVEKSLRLLRKFPGHRLKIGRALEWTVGEWSHRAHRLVLILNMFCVACEGEREVNQADIQRLILLNEYIRQIFSTPSPTLTFQQFYATKISP